MDWIPAHEILEHPECFSDSMDIVPLLLAFPGMRHPEVGRYTYTVNEFSVIGAPGDRRPTHFMPMPKMP